MSRRSVQSESFREPDSGSDREPDRESASGREPASSPGSGRELARAADCELEASLERSLERLGLRGSRLLVAVSGGIDSTVLLHALCGSARRFELSLHVAHIDHGLRGQQSADDASFVAELAGRLGLSIDVEAVDPQALHDDVKVSSRLRPTLQEAARDLRYAALRALAARRGCDRIATAHTADDQAETVLLRLLRGSGPDGLGGIPERSPDGVVVRPFLRSSRADVEAFARRYSTVWREDASNTDEHYSRNRLRLRWLPGLANDFNPQLLRTLGDLAETCRTDAEWMASVVAEETQKRFRESEDGLAIARAGWAELPEALARRLVRSALVKMGAGREVTRAHLLRGHAFLAAPAAAECGRALEFPAGLRLVRYPRHCLLSRLPVAKESAC
jgi:tRNA(Ile)-lysidine synthase